MEDLREHIGSWAIDSEDYQNSDPCEQDERQQMKSISPCNTPSQKRNLSERDLRNRLGRNRRESDTDRTSCLRSEDDIDRPNYRRQKDGLSPLRSPLSSGQQSSHSGRRGYQSSRRSRNNATENTQGSPTKRTRMQHTKLSPSMSGTRLDKDLNDGTPILSKFMFQETDSGSGHRSRRRLNLPSDGKSVDDDEEPSSLNYEEDKVTLMRREKQISYGRNTDSYKQYIETVPKSERCEDRKKHPRTPVKWFKCSRRNWDAQVAAWKRHIHEWAGIEKPSDLNSPSPVPGEESLSGTSSQTEMGGEESSERLGEEDEDDFLDLDGVEFIPTK